MRHSRPLAAPTVVVDARRPHAHDGRPVKRRHLRSWTSQTGASGNARACGGGHRIPRPRTEHRQACGGEPARVEKMASSILRECVQGQNFRQLVMEASQQSKEVPQVFRPEHRGYGRGKDCGGRGNGDRSNCKREDPWVTDGVWAGMSRQLKHDRGLQLQLGRGSGRMAGQCTGFTSRSACLTR